MKKGFTLIELLAVIVILAIIALIATPIIISIIENTKGESEKRSVDLYASAIKNAIASYQLTHKDAPTQISQLTVEYDGDVECSIAEIYEDGNVYLSDCKVNGNEVDYMYGTAVFAEDSWATIAANVKSGNLNVYNVGDTKEIALTGYTNGEANSNGLYTVRIANTTKEECKNLASQTACGFVIEFVDIITKHNMNSTDKNVGGWKDSNMYKFLNDTTDETITSIYESLPEELQKVIIDTTVVSSHGHYDTSNFTSTDKLYLLSTKEVYGTSALYDTVNEETRQLDYYKDYKNSNGSIGVTLSNYSGAIKKYNGSNYYWWLRSAYSDIAFRFYIVYASGDWRGSTACCYPNGVAPAFRIG